MTHIPYPLHCTLTDSRTSNRGFKLTWGMRSQRFPMGNIMLNHGYYGFDVFLPINTWQVGPKLNMAEIGTINTIHK